MINGFPPKIDELALRLRDRLPRVRVHFVYHGNASLSHFREDLVIQRQLELYEAGAVTKLGFVKSGMSEYFRSRGYPAEHLMNVLRMPFQPVREALGAMAASTSASSPRTSATRTSTPR